MSHNFRRIIFADATKGVNAPYGLAADGDDNIYVANNPPSAPAFILKFNPSGVPSSFATGISSQPNMRGMTFDLNLERNGRINERDRDLYAASERKTRFSNLTRREYPASLRMQATA